MPRAQELLEHRLAKQVAIQVPHTPSQLRFERLAHATTNKGYSAASPLQARV